MQRQGRRRYSELFGARCDDREQHVPRCNRLPDGRVDAGHDTRVWRLNRLLHLHGLEHHELVACLDLLPLFDGYLDDGSPMYRLEDIAERLGVSPAEAEEAMHKMLAEREALGLSNAGIVTDAARIHRKQ